MRQASRLPGCNAAGKAVTGSSHAARLDRDGFPDPRMDFLDRGVPFDQAVERSGRRANRQLDLETLVQFLTEPTGRQARRRAVRGIGVQPESGRDV